MGMRKRKLLLNWCAAHGDLKQWIDNSQPDDGSGIRNGMGWTYVTFFPGGTKDKEVLYDIDQILKLAQDNNYYLPHEVVVQHNKIVLTVYREGATPASPLVGIFPLVASFAARFDDVQRYPAHGFYGKFGGIYERPEKGRVLTLYSRNNDALLVIYESLAKLISEIRVKGFRFDLSFSNGLSAIPRMLYGFDDPEYRHSGAKHYRITDPVRFAILLDQARKDYEMYRFDERGRQYTQPS
ncbi:MAG: hypothetical protein L7F78_22995 [Syntrophales bacterium LBB04]|nr:hypothetical protein [Syntrophales bacterium LBB04]